MPLYGTIKRTLPFLVIAFTGIFCYSNTFNVPFHLDDKPNIVENPIIKDLSYFIHPAEAMKFTGFAEFPALKRRYVGHLSFALNYRAHGLDVTGYHITNLAIHLTSGALLYWLVMLTFNTPALGGSSLKEKSRLVALITALLFISHPVQTQAVTYIVQRLASLATLVYLLSLVLYIKARLSTEKNMSYLLFGLSILCVVVAMNTKQIAFTLPVIISLYEFMFFSSASSLSDGEERKGRKRALYLIPFLLAMLIIPLTHLDAGPLLDVSIGEHGDSEIAQGISRSDYILTEFRVMVTYLRLLVLPLGQNLDYDYLVYRSFLDPQVLLSFLFLSGLLGLAVFCLYRSRISDGALRIVAFGIFWFFITLSVESSIVPLHPIYEHRLYLPGAGIFMTATTTLFLLLLRPHVAWGQAVGTALLVIIISAMSATTYARNTVWQSETALWEDVVSKSPDSARAHNNLGLAYQTSGLARKAIRHYKLALNLDPYYSNARENLANIYIEMGLNSEALKQYSYVLKHNPLDENAHNNIGAAYYRTGLIENAIDHYLAAVEIKPYYGTAHNNLGHAYYGQGLLRKAIDHYQIAVQLMPDDATVHNNIGAAYYALGTKTSHEDLHLKAKTHYRKAIDIHPLFADAYNNLGMAYLTEGLYDEAIVNFKSALRIDPNNKRARMNLERTMADKNK
jgi:tetratricopeptide (TPR) repeat protein